MKSDFLEDLKFFETHTKNRQISENIFDRIDQILRNTGLKTITDAINIKNEVILELEDFIIRRTQ
jgi:hypothetical protein